MAKIAQNRDRDGDDSSDFSAQKPLRILSSYSPNGSKPKKEEKVISESALLFSYFRREIKEIISLARNRAGSHLHFSYISIGHRVIEPKPIK